MSNSSKASLRFKVRKAHSIHNMAEQDGGATTTDQHDTVAHDYQPRLNPVAEITSKVGLDILHDPGLNKVSQEA